jgi:hypothetical protein
MWCRIHRKNGKDSLSQDQRAPEKHEFRLLSACRDEYRRSNGSDENIEIIDKASTDFKLRMKELLHILKRKPELNKQLNSQSNQDI